MISDHVNTDMAEMLLLVAHCCVTVDGGWSNWRDWQDCKLNGSCGVGWTLRKRYCINPRPRYGGEHCGKNDSEFKKCTIDCTGTAYCFFVYLDFQYYFNWCLFKAYSRRQPHPTPENLLNAIVRFVFSVL